MQSSLQLSKTQKSEIVNYTGECLDIVRRYFLKRNINGVNIEFTLRGSAAGQYHPDKNLIKYNAAIAAKNFQVFKERTVPHEVAHHAVKELANGVKSLIKPHGREWRHIMEILGVRDLTRCHSYNMDGIRVKRQQRVPYDCSCSSHQVSMTIHNRIRRGAVYRCRQCNKVLVLA